MTESDAPDSLPTEPWTGPPEKMAGPSPGVRMSDSAFEVMLGAGESRGGGWQPPAPEELQAQFPQYEVAGLLGRGGMGAVYKAWQTSLDRFVAIKLLPPQMGGDDLGFAERFKREAKALARLRHPGIVAVYDAGTTAHGLLYFIMEYIEGTDLQRLMAAQGRLPIAEAVAVIGKVCDALAYAHQQGIVHRDIKPANVLIESDGTVKVADFGLAKSMAANTTLLTQSHVAMGTPDFMAPEALLASGQVDQRADLYALGVMLYQMLTGRLPRGRFDPASQSVPDLDKRIDYVIDRALKPDPAARYSSAIEMRGDLEAALTPMDRKQLAPAGKKDRRPSAMWAGGGAAVVLAGVALLHFAPWQKRGENPAGTRSGVPETASAPAVLAGSDGRAGARPSNARKELAPGASEPANVAIEPGAMKLWDAPENIPAVSGVRWDHDALLLGIDGKRGTLFSPKMSRDGILRASVRTNPDAEDPQINLRRRSLTGDGPGSGANCEHYALGLSLRTRSLVLRFVHGEEVTELKRWPLPQRSLAEEWARLELRAEGAEFTVSINGQRLGTVRDASHPNAGCVMLFANAKGYFRDVVYVPMDQSGAAANFPPLPGR